MTKRKLSKDGSFNVTDERINTISHTIGAMGALLGWVILIVASSLKGDPWKIVSFSIYGFTLVAMFVASALHHGINSDHKTEEIFRLFDYLAIFPLIAGTYTPICLVTLAQDKFWQPYGWVIFGVVWFIAAFGISIKSVFTGVPKWFTNSLYVGMGWIGAILIVPVFKITGIYNALLILIGGVFYTVGSAVFYLEKPNPIKGIFGFHEIWHLFVLAGAFCHYVSVYFFVL